MHYKNAHHSMTREQCARMGRASQKIQALRRLAEGDRADIPIRSGLQMACITIDMRTPIFEEHSILLFDAGYHNRYRYMINFEKQNGLIGWHDAVRLLAKQHPPLIQA